MSKTEKLIRGFFLVLIVSFLLYNTYLETGLATTALIAFAYFILTPAPTLIIENKKQIALLSDAIESMQKSIIMLYDEMDTISSEIKGEYK